MASSAMRTPTLLLDVLDLDDLLIPVRAARRAHPVRPLRITAARTRDQRRRLGFVMRAALTLALLRCSLLRNRHGCLPQSVFLQPEQRGPPVVGVRRLA